MARLTSDGYISRPNHHYKWPPSSLLSCVIQHEVDFGNHSERTQRFSSIEIDRLLNRRISNEFRSRYRIDYFLFVYCSLEILLVSVRRTDDVSLVHETNSTKGQTNEACRHLNDSFLLLSRCSSKVSEFLHHPSIWCSTIVRPRWTELEFDRSALTRRMVSLIFPLVYEQRTNQFCFVLCRFHRRRRRFDALEQMLCWSMRPPWFPRLNWMETKTWWSIDRTDAFDWIFARK